MSRLSVVIPALNAAPFIGEALDSVFAQGVPDLEVVVVDDGSTDSCPDVVRRYGRGVRLVEQARTGSGRARNQGIAATSGELIAFLDADDIWKPEKTARQLELLARRDELALVFSDMIAFDDGRTEARTYFQQRGFDGRCTPSSIFLYDMVSTPTVILRRACLEAVGVFDESLPIGQDTDLWLRIALRFPFACVPTPLVLRRFHAGNVTRAHRTLARCVVEIWGRHLDACVAAEPAMRTRLVADFRRKQWEHQFVEGCALLHEGDRRAARTAFRRAIALAPQWPRPYAFVLASLLGWPFARRGERG